MLGTDEANEMNGKRTLTKFNALNAAREIIGKWKNMSDQEDSCSVSEGLSDAELVRLYDNDDDGS